MRGDVYGSQQSLIVGWAMDDTNHADAGDWYEERFAGAGTLMELEPLVSEVDQRTPIAKSAVCQVEDFNLIFAVLFKPPRQHDLPFATTRL